MDISPELVSKADVTLQILADQVSSNISSYITNTILPDVRYSERLNWKAVRVLMVVSLLPQGAPPAMLARLTKYDPATITRIYDQLADCDYVYQVSNENDARSLITKITSQGQQFIDSFFAQYRCQQMNFLSHDLPQLTEDEVIDVFQVVFSLQERAENLASLTLRGRMKSMESTQFSIERFNENFDFYKTFPDFALHIICGNISTDYMTFLNRHVIKSYLKPTKLKLRELRVLGSLHYYQLPTQPSVIAKKMQMDPATVTRAVKILSQEGYLEVQDDDYDERTKRLWITNLGHSFMQTYLEKVDKALDFAEQSTGRGFSDLRKQEMLMTLLSLRERSVIFVNSKRCIRSIVA